MNLPSLRGAADLQAWANALVAELARTLEVLSRVQLRRSVLETAVYSPADLPQPTRPGLLVTVQDGTAGTLMLISTDSNSWRRVDNLSVYP